VAGNIVIVRVLTIPCPADIEAAACWAGRMILCRAGSGNLACVQRSNGDAAALHARRTMSPHPKRRTFLRSLAGAAMAPALAGLRPAAVRATVPGPTAVPAQAPGNRLIELALRAAPARANLVGAQWPATDVWAYNASIPGPEIRLRQGDRLRVRVENALEQETTVHWHGIRLPNAMDGVPHLTQHPIEPRGGTFLYEFDVPDAGTFWYHPHAHSSEQLERGLSGPLIVEERDPPAVDRDLVWVLDDWRLDRDAKIVPDFGNLMDATHAGRIGNAVTVNGAVTEEFPVRAGERLRLRLVNVANARVFALEFEGHAPLVIALDGHPVTPRAPADGRVVLGPGMRADLILDCTASPGSRHRVIDRFLARTSYRVLNLAYSGERPLRENALPAPAPLPPNPVAEPDLARAVRQRIVLGGGMMGMMGGMGGMGGMDGMGGMGGTGSSQMGGMDGMGSSQMGGMSGMGRGTASGPEAMRDMMRRGMAWTINGVATASHTPDPLFTAARGETVLMEIVNDTAWWHPIHLHGFAFRLLTRNGAPVAQPPLLDTSLLAPNERSEVAFVADNPGLWMLHCHILEHQGSGMMGVVRVS
jgi:FtsP/CotA-like multicopper oxidase with cupredoxin domain